MVMTKGTSGTIGKEIVFRTTKTKTFSAKYPDMSNIIPSKNQTKGRKRFAAAVAFAKGVLKSPVKASGYKVGKAVSVYHAAIKDYLASFNLDNQTGLLLPVSLEAGLKELSLNEFQLRAIAYIVEYEQLTNGIYQKMNGVSKATATRHLAELVSLKIIQSNKGKGAGAHYGIGSRFKK